MKVTIGLPHQTERIPTRFVNSLIGLIVHSLSSGIEISRVVTYRDNITFARNKIASQAYKDESDYLLFIDDDMVFDPDMLTRLLEHKEDIVGGLTFIRTEPHEPSFYKKHTDGRTYVPIYVWKSGALVECHAIGMAATLISRKVLDKMKDTSQYHNGIWGFFDNHDFIGEDLRFCDKAVGLGFKVHCDTKILVGHLGEKIVRFGDYAALADERMKGLKNYQATKKYGQEIKV